jgi:hypothetical protein
MVQYHYDTTFYGYCPLYDKYTERRKKFPKYCKNAQFYDLNSTHTNCVEHTKYVYRKINSIQLICYIDEYCELWISEMGTYDHISITISLLESMLN